MSDTELRSTSNVLGGPRKIPRPAHTPDPVFGRPRPDGELGQLAHYRVLRRLGCGGMGAVYLGIDDRLDRKVALKVMLPEACVDPSSRERFLREARAAAAVRSDHVVTIYQVGEDDGIPFIAMEYLSGYPLDEYLARKGRLTVQQALRVGHEAASGLAGAHALGLVHRDIKPANLWLEAPQGRVKILDFGIARHAVEDPRKALTGTGLVVGTPGYMSPEQARGKPVDHRTDLFSLGVVLYELTTGRHPFEGDTVLAILTAMAVDNPPPVRSLNPDVPAGFETIVHRLLAKQAADRPASAAVVADELRTLMEGRGGALNSTSGEPQVVYVPVQVTAYEPSAFEGIADGETAPVMETTPERAKPRAGRGVWAAVAAALLLAAGIVVGTVYALRAPTPKEPAPVIETKPPSPPAAKPAPPKPALPSNDPEADRRLAEWAIAHEGEVTTTDGFTIRTRDPMPTARFKVQAVRVGGRLVTNDDLDIFRGANELRTISLGVTEIDDAGFEKWSKFPGSGNLTKLSFAGPKLTAAGFAHIARFHDLQRLEIGGSGIGDDGLFGLHQLGQLSHLGLNASKLTDKAVPTLVNLWPVSSMDLGNTAIGDAGLKELVKKGGLIVLNLQGNDGVTDAGLEQIAGWKYSFLNVMNTKVTAAGVEKFRKAHPAGTLNNDFDKK